MIAKVVVIHIFFACKCHVTSKKMTFFMGNSNLLAVTTAAVRHIHDKMSPKSGGVNLKIKILCSKGTAIKLFLDGKNRSHYSLSLKITYFFCPV